ncbi:MAG: hypothetical protein KNU04_gp04 [crAssphage sp. isolate ctbg_1]|uniref:Uncharacterized protein n=1 Tax=crAssphage sp. isolate ctbg_1 TaxID=2989854 RepID=A0A345MSY3_9CAUD|nr:MAG: hypothetical protein KNU04_gp04 [crAssphage sp. isolate ctbg_1]AXH74483.1 MAG: hypothetical protein [crAssphage sp. isolate ctbg_1]
MTDANRAIVDEQFVDISNDEYRLQTVDIDNILADLKLNEEDNALTKSVILDLERSIADTIKSGLIASLPQVGILQRNPVKDIMKARNKEIREAKANLSKEDYKVFAKKFRADIEDKVKQDYNKRKVANRFKYKLGKLYTKLAMERGKLYADIYIEALRNCKTIPFDRAIQDQYDRLNGIYED